METAVDDCSDADEMKREREAVSCETRSETRGEKRMNYCHDDVVDRGGTVCVTTSVDDDDEEEEQRHLTMTERKRLHFWPGQEIDVMDTVSKWSEARVVAVKGQKVLITYTYWSDRWDEWLPFESERLANRGAKTYRDESSRMEAGQRIEALDEFKNWLEAEVLDTCPQRGVFIHYRNYHQKFDEWIPLNAKRIRPFGRLRKVSKKPLSEKIKVYDKSSLKPTEESAFNSEARPTTFTLEAAHRNNQVCTHLQKNNFEPNSTSHRKRTILVVPEQKNNDKQIQLLEGHAFERYRNTLAKRQLHLLKVAGDGNCLFRSVSHQIYGDDSHHELVRQACVEYMRLEYSYFESFVASDFETYLEDRAKPGVWGDEPELQALCELYDRPAQVWSYDAEKECAAILRVYGGSLKMPMRLSYYGGGHYDSIINLAERPHPTTPFPGDLERQGLERRRQRATVLSSPSLGLQNDLSTALALTDAEATDAASLQAALESSRRHFDARDSDLDAALKASLLSSNTDQKTGLSADDAMLDPRSVSAIREAEESDVATALKLSMHSAEDEAYSKSLQASFHEASQSDDAHLAAAIQSSVYEFGTSAQDEDMDPELAAAIAASLEDQQ